MVRLHRSSWLVGSIALAVSTLIIIPGSFEDSSWNTLTHGWPLQYLRRDTGDTPDMDDPANVDQVSVAEAEPIRPLDNTDNPLAGLDLSARESKPPIKENTEPPVANSRATWARYFAACSRNALVTRGARP